MKLADFNDAILYNLTGKVASDFINNDKQIYEVCTVDGLTDLSVIFGVPKDKIIAGSLYPYLRFEVDGMTVPDNPINKIQPVQATFEIGIHLEQQSNSLKSISDYIDSFNVWLKDNLYLRHLNKNNAVGIEPFNISLQFLENLQTQTIDERYAVFQGGWKTIS